MIIKHPALAFALILIAISAGSFFYLLKNGPAGKISYEIFQDYLESFPSDKKEEITIIFGGDVMFDRRIRLLLHNSGHKEIFSAITPLLKKADFSVVNLEGPITTNDSMTYVNGQFTKSFQFTFPAHTAGILKDVGIDYVSLANNHTDNFGRQGLIDTKNFLRYEDIGFFGSPSNEPNSEIILEKKGIKIALVGYHEFQNGFDNIIRDIRRLDKEAFVIVFPHWGDEYETTASPRLKTKALAFIEAGADAIIGAHPHVVMNNEWIDGVPVYYSLGNLLFDQYFSKEVMQGNLIRITLEKQENGIPRISEVKIYETSLSSKEKIELVE